MPLATFSYFIGLGLGVGLSVAEFEHTISAIRCTYNITSGHIVLRLRFSSVTVS